MFSSGFSNVLIILMTDLGHQKILPHFLKYPLDVTLALEMIVLFGVRSRIYSCHSVNTKPSSVGQALDIDFTEENRQQCAAAADPLIRAVDELTTFASSPEFASVPAKISHQVRYSLLARLHKMNKGLT